MTNVIDTKTLAKLVNTLAAYMVVFDDVIGIDDVIEDIAASDTSIATMLEMSIWQIQEREMRSIYQGG